MGLIQRYVAPHAQRGRWFLHGLAPESAAYNVVPAWRISSQVDGGALAEGFAEMANRYDALRTTYRETDGAVWAEVHDRVDALRTVDVRGTTDTDLMRQIADEAHRPFDLEHGPVFRPSLFTVSHEDHVLALMAHQIVADGWSLRIFMKDLGLLYDAHAAGRSPVLPRAGASCEEFSRGRVRGRRKRQWQVHLAKVLTGLYPPNAGEIRLDGHLVAESTREWYHAHFSAIFSDFYLFDRLLGLSGPDLAARTYDSLARLELEGKVQVENGVFSTTALSSGQRKQLALLISLLEDRPIYVFDEWAADQDAHFRDIFYSVLVPELRRKGKGVIVISHDDRYYRLGDRTLQLTYGQMSP
jgi:ABC-type lipoprotein export system ATPase subunit